MSARQILRGYIEHGETMREAIERVAVLAGQNDCMGYELCCQVCDEPYEKEAGGYACACTRKAGAP